MIRNVIGIYINRSVRFLLRAFFYISMIALIIERNTSYLLAWTIIPLIVIVISIIASCFKNPIKAHKEKAKEKENATTESGRDTSKYEAKSLLTETENQFFQFLKKDLEDYDVVITTKVRLEDLVKVKSNDFSEIQKLRGYVKSRHIDFIVCNGNMEVVAGIEVDDASHNSADAKKIDTFKNDIFRKIGKELYRVTNVNKLKEASEIITKNMANRGFIQKKIKV